MSETRVHLDVSEWDAFLKWLTEGMRDVVPMLKAAFLTAGYSDVIEHFKMEMGQDGKWRARAASTQAMYAAIASGRQKPPKGMRRGSYSPSNRLLQLTGQLRGSLMRSNVERMSSKSIMFYSNDIKAGTHDEGDPKRGIPQREFMWLSDKSQETMLDIILEFLAGGPSNTTDIMRTAGS